MIGHVKVGKNVEIGLFCAIGNDGFQKKTIKGKITHVKHEGSVIIGNDVCIHSNVCIDRGLKENDKTIISDNVHIDNLVHVAHNCFIGENTIIIAGTILGGSCKIGNNCFLGMNCTILPKIIIPNNTKVGAGAVVTKNFKEPKKGHLVLVGCPARILKKLTRECKCCGERECEEIKKGKIICCHCNFGKKNSCICNFDHYKKTKPEEIFCKFCESLMNEVS